MHNGAFIEGFGLGLLVAKQFVSLLGGEIGVESKVREGSTFWIQLPNSNK